MEKYNIVFVAFGCLYSLVAIYVLVFHRRQDKLEKEVKDKIESIEINMKVLTKLKELKKKRDIEHFEEILKQIIALIDILINIIKRHVEISTRSKLMIEMLKERKDRMINQVRSMELNSGSAIKQNNALLYYSEGDNLKPDICHILSLLIHERNISQENISLANRIMQICFSKFKI